MIKDNTTAAMESHAITPSGVEIRGWYARTMFSVAIAAGIVIVVIESLFPCFHAKSVPDQDCLSCYDLRQRLKPVKDLTIAPGLSRRQHFGSVLCD
jgi:hypothetical protein